MNGILIINKPIRWTSFQVIRFLKKKLKMKKIGHSGTLDPIATGVLCVGTGKGTKIMSMLNLLPKVYVAEAKLGFLSNTYDADGEIKRVSDKEITGEQLEAALGQFSGRISQTPPIFSALKFQGKPAYQYARKGEEITLQPREVNIHHIKLLDYEFPIFRFEVKCSSGTYIRSLIHDVGHKLETGALMTSLCRKEIGHFSIRKALEINDEITKEEITAKRVDLTDAVNFLPRIELEENFPLGDGLPLNPENFIRVDETPYSPFYYIIQKKSKKRILAIVKKEKIDYNSCDFKWSYCRIIKYDD